MRIISGKLKGRRITAPKKLPVRPTTDMAKEALFNILNHSFYFEDLKVLDLFSGTGNISLEFASRGTQNITAVDNNRHCVFFLKKTTKELNLPIIAIKNNSYQFLEKCNTCFDIIFADPPYNFLEKDFLKIADLVFNNQLLNKNGLLIIEHSKHTVVKNHTNFSYEKKYGGNKFSFFENNTP